MPIGPQPRGARGTVEQPYSALNLRLALASFGLICCAALTGVLIWLDNGLAAVGTGILAALAIADIIVIQIRRRQRRRTDPDRHSLFE
jgi:uncharacterized membrane protein YqjE